MRKRANAKEPIVRIYFATDGQIRAIETTEPITVIVEYDSAPNSSAALRQRYDVSKLAPTDGDSRETTQYLAQIKTSASGEQSFTHDDVEWRFRRNSGQWHAYYNNKTLPIHTNDSHFPTKHDLEQAMHLATFVKNTEKRTSSR